MKEELPYIFSFTITFKEYKEFTLVHSRNQLILFSVFLLFIFTITTLISGADFKSLFIIVPIGIVVSAILSLLILGNIIYKAKRIFNSNKMIKNEQTIEILETGIQINTNTSNSLIMWDDVFKVTESKTLIIIYIARNQGMIIPKKVVDEKKLKNLISTFLESKKLRITL